MRVVSGTFDRAALVRTTSEVVLALLEISHPDLTESINVVNNTEAIESNSVNYLPFPFNITLPSDRSDELPGSTLQISNNDRSVQQALKSIFSPAKATIRVICASTPDTVEGVFPMSIKSVSIDKQTITGTLSGPLIWNEPFPWITYNPKDFPALFQQK